MAFIPALGLLLAPSLLRSGNRNSPLLLVLALLTACNGGFHWQLMRHDPAAASRALLCAIDLTLLLVSIIGGRIVPAFTSSALRGRGTPLKMHAWPLLTPAVIVIMTLVLLVDLWQPDSPTAGVIAALAALLQLLRLLQWRTAATLEQPI